MPRSLNKNFKKFADSPELYSPDILKLKSVFIEYNEKSDELKSVDTELEFKKLGLKTELTRRKESWFGYFVSLINFPKGILSLITTIFTSLFSSIEEEIRIQNDLYYELSVLTDSQIARRNFMAINCSKLESDFTRLKGKATSFQHMKDLFGGSKGYEALPLMNLENDAGTDYIDYIEPSEMSAPIMRGIDQYGRNFITIRFGHESGINQTGRFHFANETGKEHLRCQTFQERYSNSNTWVACNSEFVRFESAIIYEGLISEFNAKALEMLKVGIQNKKHKNLLIQ